MSNYSFRVLDESKKQVEITYNNKTLRFQLKVKRSFTVLKKLLEAYPNFINIHSLDSILNDPNRAHSDLRISNGFAGFLIEKKVKNVMHVKLDAEKLFEICKTEDPNKFLTLSPLHLRENLSQQNKNRLYKKFKGKCNITGIKLQKELKGSYFFKHSLLASYDHRRPISKGGSNELFNWQLVSKLVNDEKNKICNTCDVAKCEECALAYPEKFNKILPTGQNINKIFKKK